jgi:glycerol-3-phosphate dehydrogenase
MCKAYGTRIVHIMGSARSAADLGEQVAPALYEAELQYLRDAEWARGADDVLWRRSKLGLYVGDTDVQRIERWFGNSASRTSRATPAA